MSSRQPIVTPEPFVPGGVLASLAIAPYAVDAHAADAPTGVTDLHAAEQAMAESFPPARRASFIAGRLALRAAVREFAPSEAVQPLLQTSRGAPQLPSGVTGSISHKRARAIAIAAPSSGGIVGVDLEERPDAGDLARPSIAVRILTPYEQERLAPLDPLAHREATLVHFALKEAVYKSIDPYVGRYVRFVEVELDVHDDGRATVRLQLPELGDDEVTVHAHWRIEDRWIVAMARSLRR